MPKLHLRGPRALPLCGRQLNNHRDSRAQRSDNVSYAEDTKAFLEALLSNNACKHCGYTSGILVKTKEIVEVESDE